MSLSLPCECVALAHVNTASRSTSAQCMNTATHKCSGCGKVMCRDCAELHHSRHPDVKPPSIITKIFRERL